MLLIITLAVFLVAVTARDANLWQPGANARSGQARSRHLTLLGRSRRRAAARWWWE